MKYRRPSALLFALVAFVGILADRPASAADQALIDAAKKEGQVTWYSIQVLDQLVRPMARAFEAKYGITLNFVRADPAEIALRALNEAKAGHVQADVIDGTQGTAGLKKEGLILKWQPEVAATLSRDFVDPEGYWVATNFYVLMVGFNTDLVPKGTEPKTWDDLLDPKWRGKMVWNIGPTTSAAAGVVGLMLHERGEEKGLAYLHQLAEQKITGLRATARQILDEVIAGEYPLGLQLYPNAIAFSAGRGAPVARSALQPALGAMVGAAVLNNAPHPNAAKLLYDFLLSDEGQTIYRDNDYLPVSPAVPMRDPSLRPDGVNLRVYFVNPEQENDALPGWMAVVRDVFP